MFQEKLYLESWGWHTNKHLGGSLDTREYNLKIRTPRGNNIITTADELINPVDLTWDAELVKSISWAVDAKRILQISITPGREDFVARHYNRNGLFLVRSAYHCQWEEKFGQRSNSVQASGVNRSQAGRSCGSSKSREISRFLGGGLSMDLSHAELFLPIGILLIREDAPCV